MAIDVTERTKLTREIERSEYFQSSLLNNLPFIALVLKKNTREIVFCNDSALEYGAKVGETCYESICKTDKICPFCKAGELWKTGLTQFIETEYIGKFWEARWIPFTDDLCVHYIVDITNRKKAESELIAAKERVVLSDKLKTALIQNMSHEIRTPLNGIIGFSDILKREGIIESKRKEYAGIIFQNGNDLNTLLNNVIDISGIEAGQTEVRKSKFDINRLIADLVKLFENRAKNIGLSVIADNQYSSSKNYIISDKNFVNQILRNLIENSLKFTFSGSIELVYQTSDNFIQFYVRDTGKGINAENYEKIYERFLQEDITFSGTTGGAGLGLSIVKVWWNCLAERYGSIP